VRTTATPLVSTASTPNVKRPRAHPAGTPRTALNTGAAASSSQTRTLRTATHACHPLPRRQRAATQRTTSASRREASPPRATCSHAPPVVVHVPPHHSQPSPDCTPASQPALRESRASSSTPEMTSPAGASNTSAPDAPTGAVPRPGVECTTSPSPEARPPASTVPAGHDTAVPTYAEAPAADHDAFSAPKHAVTA
jgi:hypothetical protein